MFTKNGRKNNLEQFKDKLDIVAEFIYTTDFEVYEFDTQIKINDDIYFIKKKYTTKEKAANMLEDHEQMIDVHYAYKGKERVNLGSKNNLTVVSEYNQETDCAWYQASSSDLVEQYVINEDEYLILFPGECHEPEIREDSEENIKIIFKVKTN
ncbi:YhcH/YjgK/YiaL family protein [Mollicutes bacterium LVI A0039]|nr:YhcH/YjgK/YiaL family protein [Mollicutes bacterium LVI A0039]